LVEHDFFQLVRTKVMAISLSMSIFHSYTGISIAMSSWASFSIYSKHSQNLPLVEDGIQNHQSDRESKIGSSKTKEKRNQSNISTGYGYGEPEAKSLSLF
jgi:hypothetical protein